MIKKMLYFHEKALTLQNNNTAYRLLTKKTK
jgi:hypothetical protein